MYLQNILFILDLKDVGVSDHKKDSLIETRDSISPISLKLLNLVDSMRFFQKDSVEFRSLVSDFKLVCDDADKVKWIEVIQAGGAVSFALKFF